MFMRRISIFRMCFLFVGFTPVFVFCSEIHFFNAWLEFTPVYCSGKLHSLMFLAFSFSLDVIKILEWFSWVVLVSISFFALFNGTKSLLRERGHRSC